VDRVITDPSLDLSSPYEVVPWVLIPITYLLGAHNTHKWWWSTLMHDGERVLQSTRMAMPTTISMRSRHLRSSAMAMWQERWRGRSKGTLTLGGGAGREHQEVVGIVRVWGQRGENEINGIDLVKGWRNNGGGRRLCAMLKGLIWLQWGKRCINIYRAGSDCSSTSLRVGSNKQVLT
jgi:hypothetical protein